MRKILLSGCVALLLAAIVWAGGDPWKSKPYQQWDAKDVRKGLDASPWARSVQVEAPQRAVPIAARRPSLGPPDPAKVLGRGLAVVAAPLMRPVVVPRRRL